MAEIAQKHRDKLKELKACVEKAEKYFQENNKRWHRFKKFLYVSTLSDEDLAVLKELKKPQLEFNILEAYVSRQKGEFSKQEPSIVVNAVNGSGDGSAITDVVTGYMRHIEKKTRDDGVAAEVYEDMLSGGFSVEKVWTEYENDRSFDQEIKVGRAFDVTL